jgi:hypothetical protein
MKKLATFFIAILTILGLSVILYANSLSIGVGPDSVAYIASAESLLGGDGLTIPTGIDDPVPLTHFAPLYPALLGGLGVTGLDLNFLAKGLNAFLFSSILFFVGHIILQGSRNLWLLAPCASLFLLVSEDMLTIHSYAWSEGLFIALGVLGFFLFAHYLWRPTYLKLVASAGILSAAILARYAGVAILPVVFLGVLLFREDPFPKKLLRSLALTVACATPMLLWFARNYFLTGSLSNRSLVFHPITSTDVQNGLDTISNWFLPGRITGTLRDVLVVLFLIIILVLISNAFFMNLRKIKNQDPWTFSQILPTLFALFCFFYFLLLTFTILFMDAQSTFNYRLLSPLLVSGLIAFFTLLPTYLKRIPFPFQVLFGILFLLVLAFNANHSLKFVTKAHNGSFKMYAGKGWQDAEIIHAIRALPDGLPIYSNGDDALYYVLGLPAARFPRKFNPFSMEENESYIHEMDRMSETLKVRRGYIVCFTGMTWRGYLPDCKELESIFPIESLWAGDGGTIYKFPSD